MRISKVFLSFVAVLIAACSNNSDLSDNCSKSITELDSTLVKLNDSVSNLLNNVNSYDWVMFKEDQNKDLNSIIVGAKIHRDDVSKMSDLKEFKSCIQFSNQLSKLNLDVALLIDKTDEAVEYVNQNKASILKDKKCSIKEKCNEALNDKVKELLQNDTKEIELNIAKDVTELQKMTIDLSSKNINKKSVFQK